MDPDERRTASGAHHQLAAASRLTGVGYFAVDLASGRIELDARCAEILGVDATDAPSGELLAALLARLHADDVTTVDDVVRRALLIGGAFDARGRLLTATAGGARTPAEQWLAMAGTVELGETAPGTVHGAMVDHTEERLREERWLRGQKREALGTLAAGIAHDLNNVMTAVVGNVALARLEVDAGRMPTESIVEAAQASARAGEMLRRLLRFGHEDTPQKVPFDLVEIVLEACDLLEPTIEAGTTLSRPRREAPSPMCGDPTQVHQLVINLVINAVHVLPDGGHIDVVVDEVPDARGSARAGDRALRLRVSDDGPGIDEATLPRIFDPFFTTKSPTEGTGLGLAAATVIVDLHDGAIEVESVVGAGTTFAVTLPMAEADHHAAPAPAAHAKRLGAVRVAFVAVRPDLRRDARASMPSFGCIPIAFSDAATALAALALDPTGFDALVTDAAGPVEPRELIRAARAVLPHLPVIVNAGPDAVMTSAEARVLGVDAWVPRPCPPSELCAAIRRLV